jgi:hypothetical protein
LCNILNGQEVKPHKVRYYLERRDPQFKQKMAEVLCVYRQVRRIKATGAAAKQKPSDAVAIVSCSAGRAPPSRCNIPTHRACL